MNEMFVIISGEYSDWCIEGYTDSEDEAIRICISHNKENQCREWYFEKIEKMENPVRTIKIKYVHYVSFDKNMENGQWEMREEPDRYEYFENGDKSISEKSKIVFWRYNTRIILATVPLKENNRKKAEKIAQDMLYQFLAELQLNNPS